MPHGIRFTYPQYQKSSKIIATVAVNENKSGNFYSLQREENKISLQELTIRIRGHNINISLRKIEEWFVGKDNDANQVLNDEEIIIPVVSADETPENNKENYDILHAQISY